MNAPALTKANLTATGDSLALSDAELMSVLSSSIYPGAKPESIKMVLGYCRAARLDPMQKPVHIVPMDVPTGRKDSDGWDITEKRDVVMPGIGLYRIQSANSGEHVGTSEPLFGPDVTVKLGDEDVTYPQWCKVVVYRLKGDRVVEYPAIERWLENYAPKSRKSKAPNRMWGKRPYAQLAKCAEAQALRKAFPEVGSQPTAEEQEGKPLGDVVEAIGQIEHTTIPQELLDDGKAAAGKGVEAYRLWWASLTKEQRHLLQFEHDAFKLTASAADAERAKKALEAEENGPAPLAAATADEPTFGDLAP